MRYLSIAAVALMIGCASTNTVDNNPQTSSYSASTSASNNVQQFEWLYPVPGNSVVVLTQNGDRLGDFAPRSAPYSENEKPAFTTWLPGRGGVAEDGRLVTGVKVIGWNEPTLTHVRAYALVAPTNAVNLHDERTLEVRPLGDYVMHRNESATIAELSQFGVTPLIVKASSSDR
jgi:hypothetical protein